MLNDWLIVYIQECDFSQVIDFLTKNNILDKLYFHK